MSVKAQLWCLVAALLTITSCGSSPSAPDTNAPPRKIVVLGDSLSITPTPSQSFPAQLQTRLNATHPGWTIRNAGVIGDTTSDGLQRIDGVLTTDTAIMILELGANDGLRGIPTSTVETNLGTMIQNAQRRGILVLLCGMETLPQNGVNYALEFHSVFPRVAAQYSVALVPFLLEGVALNPDLNGADDLHPNAAGARVIAETVWPYLEPLVKQVEAR